MATDIDLALQQFKLCAEADKAQRAREIEDLKFQVPELMWPDDVAASRRGQTVGGVAMPPRPMLSIPKLDQPLQLVLNQEKAASLGVQIHPLSADATDDTAEMLQGLYRTIERDSRAGLARSWAFERAVKAGRGWYRVDKAFDRESDHPADQKIVIRRILYQASVYMDPAALVEPDEARFAFVTEDIPFDTYKRRHPKTELAGYTAHDFATLGDEQAAWVTGDGPGRAIRVAEYFRVEVTPKTLLLLGDQWVDVATIPGDTRRRYQDAAQVEIEERKVYWSKINGIEEIEPEQEWDGQYIPLIPVLGRELQPFDAERRFVGIIGPNKDGQRLFNYAASTAVEIAALEPKAPWLLAEGQERGHEQQFQLSNVRNFPYLLYNPKTLGNGQLVPPPTRVQADLSRLGPSMSLLQMAVDFIHAGTGAYEPTLGDTTPRAKSGRAVLALQQQHDQGNSNWLDNLAELSLTYEARVVLDLIPHVYDRPGRLARVRDGEDRVSAVMLNCPFVVDPQTKRPRPCPAPQAGAKHYDLKKGRYGVAVSVGKRYQTRLEQGADELGVLFQAEPQLFSVLGDIYLRYRDFPGHQEAADRIKKLLPPPLQQDQQDPQAAQQQVGQLQAQVQQLTGQLSQAVELLKTEHTKYAAQQAQAQIDAQTKIQIETLKRQAADIEADKELALAAMNNAAKLAVAKIQAMTKSVVVDKEAEDERIALAQDRAHEVGMMAQEHAQAQAFQATPPDAGNGQDAP